MTKTKKEYQRSKPKRNTNDQNQNQRSKPKSSPPAWFDLKVRVTVREKERWTKNSPERLSPAQALSARKIMKLLGDNDDNESIDALMTHLTFEGSCWSLWGAWLAKIILLACLKSCWQGHEKQNKK